MPGQMHILNAMHSWTFFLRHEVKDCANSLLKNSIAIIFSVYEIYTM